MLQARAAAMMRQNAELQQRQSSLERRAAYQKSLLAANRDQMQARLRPHLLPTRHICTGLRNATFTCFGDRKERGNDGISAHTASACRKRS